MEIAKDITSLVGNTPLVKLDRIRKHFNIYPEIIDSYNNKLIKFNSFLYKYCIGDFKFRDIFILLYNNE